ncbi:MAG TPA: class A beta-lactamase [Gemmatimonadaceae bacterium]
MLGFGSSGSYLTGAGRAVVVCALMAAPAVAEAQGANAARASQPSRASQTSQTSQTGREAGLERLEQEITRLAAISHGTVGVAIVHLESGESLYLNRSESFPMASTFKVPVAVEVLHRVDEGDFTLDSMITIQPGDLHPGSGTLTNLFDNPGVVLSVRNLMELMLRISDNSAADLMLRTAGGASAVNARLKALGVTGVRVDRPTVRLIADYIGIPTLATDDVPPEEFRTLARAVSDSVNQIAATKFEKDPRDTATPEGMAKLLQAIWEGKALSRANTDLLIDIMRRCLTGDARIKGILPPNTVVAHKTGSLGGGENVHGAGTQNDVGIIDLPGGSGHLIVVALVKGEDDAERGERTIAQISRAAYDYFVTNSVVQ